MAETKKIERLEVYRPAYVMPVSFNDTITIAELAGQVQAKMNEIIDKVNAGFTDEVKAYIDRRFENIMVDVLFDNNTETITLKLKDGGKGAV